MADLVGQDNIKKLLIKHGGKRGSELKDSEKRPVDAKNDTGDKLTTMPKSSVDSAKPDIDNPARAPIQKENKEYKYVVPKSDERSEKTAR